MKFSKEEKTQIIGDFRVHGSDTGSPEVQVAVLTHKIRLLTEHLKTHRKDHTSRHGLLKMVGKRTTLLRYLRQAAPDRYAAVIARLGLRH
jgi:small subunit ribosomal protein S15